MTTIVTRAGKGSALTYTEMDSNFINLNNAKLESGTAGTNIANTPAGNIVATNVQSAINELDQEKAALGVNSDITSMTGLTAPTASSNPVRAEDIQKQLVQAFTTDGTNTAYTLTPSPAISSNSVNLRFRIKFNSAAGNNPTLSVSSQPALSLKYIDSNGNKQSITAAQVPLNWVSDVECDGTNWIVLSVLPSTSTYSLFYKIDHNTSAFIKTGTGTVSIKAGTKIDVLGTIITYTSDTTVSMPTLTAGTDYAIWVKDDATIQATTNFSAAPGAGNWRKIGGFHYAPGGNAAAQAGGDTTPAINAYSFWDLKFRPDCPDPRGMTLVAGSFWSDIYLLGVDHLINGTSKYNVSIADGSTPPKIPTKFGGTGSNAYSTLNWWEANEVLQSWGKRSPTYDEFTALAYGTTEATASGGTDVPTTGVSGTGAPNAWNKFTSRWGVIQATGCLWIWGSEFGGVSAASAWTANTGGRGSTYQMENAVRFGGDWGVTAESGSRCSAWNSSLTLSAISQSARGVCGHFQSE